MLARRGLGRARLASGDHRGALAALDRAQARWAERIDVAFDRARAGPAIGAAAARSTLLRVCAASARLQQLAAADPWLQPLL
ncbi:MAG: hypothetical protein U0168_06160 [Nannocystaceae bacterium]